MTHPEMKKVEPKPLPKFTDCEFHGYIGKCSFDTSGKFHIEVVCEARDRHEAIKLVDTYGTMLRFDISRKRPKT